VFSYISDYSAGASVTENNVNGGRIFSAPGGPEKLKWCNNVMATNIAD